MGFQMPNLIILNTFHKYKGCCIFSCIKPFLFYKLTFIHDFYYYYLPVLLLLSTSVTIYIQLCEDLELTLSIGVNHRGSFLDRFIFKT